MCIAMTTDSNVALTPRQKSVVAVNKMVTKKSCSTWQCSVRGSFSCVVVTLTM